MYVLFTIPVLNNLKCNSPFNKYRINETGEVCVCLQRLEVGGGGGNLNIYFE